MKNPIWKHDEVALILIDYQPEMFSHIKTINPKLMELNVRALVRTAKALDIPIIPSTVAVNMGVNEPTVAAIQEELGDIPTIDRTTTNSWEDENFVKAVKATGKKKLIFLGLYTEICLVYPVVDALADGFEALFVADAVGGTSDLDHNMGVERMIQAGAIPSTLAAIITELFRDWASPESPKVKPILEWYLPEKYKILGVKG